MTRERLNKFAVAVHEAGVNPDDLKKEGVHKLFNDQLNIMDAAYQKDQSAFDAAETMCLGILRQVKMAKLRAAA